DLADAVGTAVVELMQELIAARVLRADQAISVVERLATRYEVNGSQAARQFTRHLGNAVRRFEPGYQSSWLTPGGATRRQTSSEPDEGDG
ncbi:hypothetical protein ABTN15_19410, partial [Acinetobacter baumannii]